ncbi:MAG: DUF2306 domain-containing protein [Hyphomicrobium sp.]|nr:DUF2306 domain-containing protein [Hyphomicrobium sp.]
MANADTIETTRTRRRRVSPLWQISRAVIIALLVVPVGVVALGSGFGIILLPFEMYVLAENMPVIFRAHMVTSAMALLLAPVVIGLRHRPHLHRRFGRVLGGFVVAGGLTALPVAIFSDSSLIARAGFFTQGCVWLALLVAGLHAIRSGERSRHQTVMLAMVAVTTGAVWFRLITGTAIALHWPFEPIYAMAAWIGWVLPLAVCLWYQTRIAKALAR